MAGPPTRKSKFAVEAWSSEGYGKRIIINGDTGIGKTTLAALAPTPVWIGLDEGGREIKHPITNKDLQRISGVKTYEDVREVLQNVSLFKNNKTIVVDTITLLQDLAVDFVVRTVPTEKGKQVTNIVGYGYNKGYRHLYEAMKSILQDCDNLIHKNINVVLIAQSAIHSVPNPAGEDFLRTGLRLHRDKQWDIEGLYCEWADHIFHIGYKDAFVSDDKKIAGDTTRVIYTQPEVYLRAKSRTLTEDRISFEKQNDDSIWQFMFPKG